jgi:hypothetical protein
MIGDGTPKLATVPRNTPGSTSTYLTTYRAAIEISRWAREAGPRRLGDQNPWLSISHSPLRLAEPAKGLVQLGDGGELPGSGQVLLPGADESLHAAVALRLPDQARRAGRAEEGQLPLEAVAGDGTIARGALTPRRARVPQRARGASAPVTGMLKGKTAMWEFAGRGWKSQRRTKILRHGMQALCLLVGPQSDE